MTIVTIPNPAAATDAIRNEFAQAAYCGAFPRDQWSRAQTLVARYDDATSQAERFSTALAMQEMGAAVYMAAAA